MKKKLLGVILAILLGLVASIPWIILGYLGWIASLAGYLIGLAAYTGYTKVNTNFDKVGKVTVAVIILVLIPFAEMVNLFIAGLQYVSFIDSLRLTPVIFFESLNEYLSTILIGYVMAGLGTYNFFLQPTSGDKTENNPKRKKFRFKF